MWSFFFLKRLSLFFFFFSPVLDSEVVRDSAGDCDFPLGLAGDASSTPES
jgi:hypothetical protein